MIKKGMMSPCNVFHLCNLQGNFEKIVGLKSMDLFLLWQGSNSFSKNSVNDVNATRQNLMGPTIYYFEDDFERHSLLKRRVRI